MGCEGCKNGRALSFGIRIAFQPIVDTVTKGVFAYEALVRGENGESAASVLAQVTSDNRYGFDQACRVAAIRSAVDAGLLDTTSLLSINFLPNAVYSPAACIRLTLKTARETSLPCERLIFEFTENEKLEADHVSNIVDAYRNFGFATAIDDFGAGHAGLNMLANLETDIIKLDMELIRGIDRSEPRRQIVAATVRLLRDLGREVIAEGIETKGEMEVLSDIGVRYMQGYYFARPALERLPMPFGQDEGQTGDDAPIAAPFSSSHAA